MGHLQNAVPTNQPTNGMKYIIYLYVIYKLVQECYKIRIIGKRQAIYV
jgi:hypothetical protein